jgi:hypothetical protein
LPNRRITGCARLRARRRCDAAVHCQWTSASPFCFESRESGFSPQYTASPPARCVSGVKPRVSHPRCFGPKAGRRGDPACRYPLGAHAAVLPPDTVAAAQVSDCTINTVNTLHRVTGAVKAGRCGRPAAARRKHVRGPPPTPLAGPSRGGGGRWRGVGARAEGGPGTAAATAAAGAGAPDGGAADTPPPPAPAEPGGGGGGVVPGGPWAMKAAAAAGDRDGATDVMVVGVDTLPRPAPSGRGGGGGGGRPAAAAGPPTRAAA